MYQMVLKSAFLIALAIPAEAESMACQTPYVSIDAQNAEYAALACRAAEWAVNQFASCNIPPVSRAVIIRIVSQLDAGCVGVYYCDAKRIDILTPPAMQKLRQADSAFALLPNPQFFQAVVVHELTHAATDEMPCPFSACVAAHEYAAYTMEVLSLTPEQQATFAKQAGIDRRISRKELNAGLVLMAPDLFAQKAWAHFRQQDDPCAFIGRIADGTVSLDNERL